MVVILRRSGATVLRNQGDRFGIHNRGVIIFLLLGSRGLTWGRQGAIQVLMEATILLGGGTLFPEGMVGRGRRRVHDQQK